MSDNFGGLLAPLRMVLAPALDRFLIRLYAGFAVPGDAGEAGDWG